MAIRNPFKSEAYATLANGRTVFYPDAQKLNATGDALVRPGFYVDRPEDRVRLAKLMQRRRRSVYAIWIAFSLICYGSEYIISGNVSASPYLAVIFLPFLVHNAETWLWKKAFSAATSHLEPYQAIVYIKDLQAKQQAKPGFEQKMRIGRVLIVLALPILAWLQLIWLPRHNWYKADDSFLFFLAPLTIGVIFVCLVNTLTLLIGKERVEQLSATKSPRHLGNVFMVVSTGIYVLVAYIWFHVLKI